MVVKKQGATPEEQALITPPLTPEQETVTPPTAEQTPSVTQADIEALKAQWAKDHEAEIARAVNDAEARVQSALMKRHKQDLEQLQTQTQMSDIDAEEKRSIEEYGESPQLRAHFQERRATRQAATEWNKRFREGYAYKYAKEYGVDEKELLEADSIEEMQEVAKRKADSKRGSDYQGLQGQIAALTKRIEEMSKPPQEIDTGRYVPGGGTGRVPSLEELQDSTPAETAQRVKKGEWRLPGTWV